MTPPRRLLYIYICSASALGAFAALAFWIPRGEFFSYEGLCVAAFLGAGALIALVYAALEAPATAAKRNPDLRPSVDWYVLKSPALSPDILAGSASLVAIVADGEVPHPEFTLRLTPYFSDPALGFVQAATRYEGTGRVAQAYRAQAALGDYWAQAQNNVGSAALRGSGALIAREALCAAYAPGISFEELGLRLRALGYGGRFEPQPMMLAYAPLTLAEYWPRLQSEIVRSLALLVPALRLRLSMAARLQQAAVAAVYGAVVCAAAAVALTPLMLLFGDGPLLFSPSAMPGLAALAVCLALTWYTFGRLSGQRLFSPLALAFAGAYFGGYTLARAAWESPAAQKTRATVAAGARAAGAAIASAASVLITMATARGGGSAGTSPAGSPARL